jgi:hypothetical protein
MFTGFGMVADMFRDAERLLIAAHVIGPNDDYDMGSEVSGDE